VLQCKGQSYGHETAENRRSYHIMSTRKKAYEGDPRFGELTREFYLLREELVSAFRRRLYSVALGRLEVLKKVVKEVRDGKKDDGKGGSGQRPA